MGDGDELYKLSDDGGEGFSNVDDGGEGFRNVDDGGEGFRSGDNGVRVWFNELGLEGMRSFHEVDNDVLPMLTLVDLEDMGINAVGDVFVYSEAWEEFFLRWWFGWEAREDRLS